MKVVNNMIKTEIVAGLLGILLSCAQANAAIVTRFDASGFTSAGAISTWSPLPSGLGNDVTQGVGGSQPTVVLGEQNGLSVVRFDGLDDHMDNSLTSYTVGSVFAVAYCDKTVFGNVVYDGLYGGDNGTDAVYYTGTANSTDWYGDTVLDSMYLNGVSSTTALTTPSAFNLYSGTDSTPQLLGGHALATDRNNPGNRQWDGDIAEVIVYDTALSEFDRQGVEVYLDEKWGLGLNLRSTYGDGNFNEDTFDLGLVPFFTLSSSTAAGPTHDNLPASFGALLTPGDITPTTTSDYVGTYDLGISNLTDGELAHGDGTSWASAADASCSVTLTFASTDISGLAFNWAWGDRTPGNYEIVINDVTSLGTFTVDTAGGTDGAESTETNTYVIFDAVQEGVTSVKINMSNGNNSSWGLDELEVYLPPKGTLISIQ
jgi:hypothetical protein